jgi:hypothetical protein
MGQRIDATLLVLQNSHIWKIFPSLLLVVNAYEQVPHGYPAWIGRDRLATTCAARFPDRFAVADPFACFLGITSRTKLYSSNVLAILEPGSHFLVSQYAAMIL